MRDSLSCPLTTVCLAIPLYQQIKQLKIKVSFSLEFGGVLLDELMHGLGVINARLSHEEYVTLLPKSITTAIEWACLKRQVAM